MSFNPRYRAKAKSVPAFVIDNIDSIRKIRKTCNISLNTICKAVGLRYSTYLLDIELGRNIPSKSLYNKLAEFFDWEVWV